jgi:hypothetical protein
VGGDTDFPILRASPSARGLNFAAVRGPAIGGPPPCPLRSGHGTPTPEQVPITHRSTSGPTRIVPTPDPRTFNVGTLAGSARRERAGAVARGLTRAGTMAQPEASNTRDQGTRRRVPHSLD